MASAAVLFKPVSHDGMICEVRSPQGRLLRLTGTLSTIEPKAEGDDAMVENPALVHNAWAYAKHEKQYRRFKNEEKRISHRKQADAYAKTAEKIAELIDFVGSTTRNGWCSACYTRSDHRKVNKGRTTVPVYLCVTCGSPTLKCAAPQCGGMATRGFGSIRIPRFCAEHRHEISSFERAADKVASLDDYEQLRIFDKRNLTRGSRLALTGVLAAGVVGTGGLMAAPAIGGAIGTLVGGYTGAAATSYGLALLGGGAISAGGLGMVGGTYVAAAAGAALGSALGASITNAYVSEDKSFRIEKFRNGDGTPVIIARGFMTEVDQNWRYAVESVERRYPDSPIYRLHWGSKELGALFTLTIKNVGAKQAMGAAAVFAARAGRTAAKKLGPVAPALLIADLAKNPWHTAMVRADKTGAALAGILAHTTAESYILVGHSLGARAMVTAAETLGTSRDSPRIDTVHLLGAAEGKKGDWRPLSDAVAGTVYNYYSTNDPVLKFAYTAAQAGSVAVGLRGFTSKFSNIKDRDVSSLVKGHSDYFRHVRLA
jgi:pimeloyl-ACP methyl ester carboxylesterase